MSRQGKMPRDRLAPFSIGDPMKMQKPLSRDVENAKLAPSRSRWRYTWALSIVGCLALVLFFTADVRRDSSGLADSCVDYLKLVESCMGKDTAARVGAAFSRTTRDKAAQG